MKQKNLRGFTLMEVAVVISMLALLFGLVWINLLGTKEKSSQASTVDTFLSDVRSQQLKAMLGDTEGRVNKDTYGVQFGTTSYTLFHGPTYSAVDPSNSVVKLGDNEQFQNVLFPNSLIRFASVSGEIAGFNPSNNSLILYNSSGKTQKTIRFNKYGTITLIN